VSNHLGVLLGVLSKAKEWKKLREIPKINWPKIPEPEFDFLTFEEAPRLIAGADVEWAPMIALAIHTGLRRGELRALRWEDVDLVAGKLLVRQAVSVGENGPVIGTPKSGKKREIPLNAIAQEALKAQRRQGIRGELVFPHPDGRLLSEGELRIGLERACRKAGLRQIGWHALRHTFASHLVMRRVPLRSVQELLGHSKVDITMRYAHLSPEVGREAVKALEGEVSPAATGGADYAKVLEKLRNRS
jgi:integrase